MPLVNTMHRHTPTISAVLGILLVVLGVFCSTTLFPRLENYLLSKETALKKGTNTYREWQNMSFPLQLKVYFFNVTNPDEIQTGAQPILTEIGPYIYDEFRSRDVISEENNTIKYYQKSLYYFNAEESGSRSENDVVTILNIGVVTTANKLNGLGKYLLDMINKAFPFLFPEIQNVFMTNSVRKILFEGVVMSCEAPEVENVCGALENSLPPTVRKAENNRDFLISLFHHINDTDDGPYIIETASSSKGKIVSFQDSPIVTEWNGASCETIKGTDLTINQNFFAIPKEIHFFAPDLCRSFSVNFNRILPYSDLNTYVFTKNNLFENDDKCYCPQDNDNNPVCPPIGTMDLGACVESPIILSQPHFFGAQKLLLNFAKGLHPDQQKHSTVIIIEPKTGVSLVVKTRFQMNLFLTRIPEIELLQNVSEGLFPFMWIEKGSVVPPRIINEVKGGLDKLNILIYIKCAIIVLGVICLFLALFFAMHKDKVLWCTNQVSGQTSFQSKNGFLN